MIAAIIEVLDLIAAGRLSAQARYGLCELKPVDGGTAPAKYVGGDTWEIISVDTGGDWSYWRLTDRIREERFEQAASCDSMLTATHALRLVTLVSREVCSSPIDVARSAASEMRRSANSVRVATKADMVRITSTGIDADTDRVYAQEFRGAGFGTVPPGKMLIAIDISVAVTGNPDCFGDCGEPVDVTCSLITAASNAKIEECLGPERLAELCDSPCPTDCEVIQGMDASEIVACVPDGDRPALLCAVIDTNQATPEAIVVCLDGADKTDAVRDIICDPCPPCDPAIINLNSQQIREINDPCGTITNIRSVNSAGDLVGAVDGDSWRIPDSVISRDGVFFANLPAGDPIDVPSDCPPCDDVTVQLQDSAGNDIGAPDVYPPGTNTTKTAPDATVQLRDSAANNIGSPVAFLSNSSNNLTAPDGSVQRQDSAGTNIGSPILVRSNQTGLVVTCPDGTVVVKNLNGTTLGSPTTKSNGSADYIAPIPLKFVFAIDNDTTITWTVTDDEAGTYGTYTQDGASGTLTYSLNGAAFAALTGTIVLTVGNTIAVKRSTYTAAGWIKWAP